MSEIGATQKTVHPETLRTPPSGAATNSPATAPPVERGNAGDIEFGPEVQRRIELIRAQITAGTYLTPEKLEVVVQRLRAELHPE